MDSNDTNAILNDSENSQSSYNRNPLPLQSPELQNNSTLKRHSNSIQYHQGSTANIIRQANELEFDTDISVK
jgi:hypothetical protein